MKVGIIGLGRMGIAIAYRLINADFEVFGFDIDKSKADVIEHMDGNFVEDITEIPKKADIIWLMLPAGEIVDKVIDQILPNIRKKSIIIDGGNSKFTDSERRAIKLAEDDIYFLDCGTSGGLQGEKLGFSLMIGGDIAAYRIAKPIFEALAMPNGYGYMGKSGSGHFVKMVHNGIEYALLESYAEGLHLLKESDLYKDLDLAEITRVWENGSIIRSWILHLAHEILLKDQEFKDISGVIGGGQTGRWTVEQAHKEEVPVPLIEKALEIRAWSQRTGGNYGTKIVALLREAFGGHEVKKINEDDV